MKDNQKITFFPRNREELDGIVITRYRCNKFIIEEEKGPGDEVSLWWITITDKSRTIFYDGMEIPDEFDIYEAQGLLHWRTEDTLEQGGWEYSLKSEFGTVSEWRKYITRLPRWKKSKYLVVTECLEFPEVILCEAETKMSNKDTRQVLRAAKLMEPE